MSWLDEEFARAQEEWDQLPAWARPVYVPKENVMTREHDWVLCCEICGHYYCRCCFVMDDEYDLPCIPLMSRVEANA